jgi:hypothetical protein
MVRILFLPPELTHLKLVFATPRRRKRHGVLYYFSGVTHTLLRPVA